jgi:hypothetical protein
LWRVGSGLDLKRAHNPKVRSGSIVFRCELNPCFFNWRPLASYRFRKRLEVSPRPHQPPWSNREPNYAQKERAVGKRGRRVRDRVRADRACGLWSRLCLAISWLSPSFVIGRHRTLSPASEPRKGMISNDNGFGLNPATYLELTLSTPGLTSRSSWRRASFSTPALRSAGLTTA